MFIVHKPTAQPVGIPTSPLMLKARVCLAAPCIHVSTELNLATGHTVWAGMTRQPNRPAETIQLCESGGVGMADGQGIPPLYIISHGIAPVVIATQQREQFRG